jgi:DNA-binding transcriptional ArsR family regulator
MSISATRAHVEETLLTFAWDQWSQMGVLARPGRSSPWAQDPEALLVFTFEVARADPRLFDEVLDWMARNEHLVSVRRLRTLATDPESRSLVEAVLAWLATHRPKARFSATADPAPFADLALVHPAEGGFPIRDADEAFALHGWRRVATSPSGKSTAPDLRAPINLGFRLRQLFGLGTRAEVMRVLLTAEAPRSDVKVITSAAAFARRNVVETLNALVEAGVVTPVRSGGEERYGLDRQSWLALLAIDRAPAHVDWVQLLAGLARILRWLRDEGNAERTGYLADGAARDLVEAVRPDLEYAGIVVPRRQTSAEAPDDLDAVIARALALLA